MRIAFAAVLCFASPLAAQTDQGSIIGDVVDGESGESVAGVVVTASSPALQGKLTATSDEQGRYRIDALPIGTYTLSFAKQGFSAEPISDIQMRPGATLRYDAVVYPEGSALYGTGGSATEVVRVTAPVVDVGSTTTGGNIDAEITRRIPVVAPGAKGGAQRSFEGAAALLPQVQNDAFGASVNGSTSVENQYVIDGISVNNTAFGYLGSPLTLEFIEDVSVITGGYLPEYGRSMGGLLNVVTKSGGNELHGSAWVNVAPGFLEGDRALALNEGSAIRIEPSLNYVGDIGFEVGGPIVHDTLWFYVGAALNQQSFKVTRRLFDANGAEIAGTQRDFFAEGTGAQAIAKVTWLANADNRLSFTFLATPSTSGGGGKLGIDPRNGAIETTTFEGSFDATAHIYQAGAFDGQVKWQSAFLDRKLRLDTSLGVHYELSSLGGLPSDGSRISDNPKRGLMTVPRTIFRRSIPGPHSIADFEAVPESAGCDAAGTENATTCPVPFYNFGGPATVDEMTNQSVGARHVASYLLEAGGLHIIKAGLEAGIGRFDNLRAYSGGRVYRETSDGEVFFDFAQYGYLIGPDEPVLLDDLHWVTHSLFGAAFIQDSWTLFDMVTLNLGLRYDAQWQFAGDGTISLALPNEISPRLGVIVDPFQSGRAKIFGSFARYYEAVPLDMADRLGSSEPEVESDRLAAVCDPRDPKQHVGSCSDPANRLAINELNNPNQQFVVVATGRTAVDPALQPPSSDEILLGAELEVFRDARLGVTYTRRWVGCPWTGAEGIAEGALCSKAMEDMSRDEASTYFIGNPGFGIASDFPIAQRNYDALTVAFYKQFSDGWLAQASYTLSQLQGNYAGLFRPETEQLDPNLNTDFDLVSLLQNRNGPLPFDKTHQLKGFVAREFQAAYDSHFTVGASGSVSSGAPSNFFGSHPLYGPDEVFILPRGSGARLPANASVDVHAAFAFKPFAKQDVEISIDVFNLFNWQEATLLDETYTDADVNPLLNCDGARVESCTPDDINGLQTTDAEAFDPRSKNANFGQALEFQDPRTVRFGLRWSF